MWWSQVLLCLLLAVLSASNSAPAAPAQQQTQATSEPSGANTVPPNYPQPLTANNRIYVMVLAYRFDRIESILAILQEYRNMCEAGWLPTVHFLTSASVSERFKRYFAMKTYCYRIKKSLPIAFRWHNASENVFVSEHNRQYVRENLHSHDLFVYQEEDIVLTLSHVAAYLEETRRLMQMGEKKSKEGKTTTSGGSGSDEMLRQYMVGFHRYYRVRRPLDDRTGLHSHSMSEAEIFKLENLNEHPFYVPICLKGKPYLLANTSKYYYNGNPHQGVYMLTKTQITLFSSQCDFFNQSIQNYPTRIRYAREYASSLSLYSNSIIPVNNCGLKKILPAERLLSFAIEHYYFPSSVSRVMTHPLFLVDEHLRAGLVQSETPVVMAKYYDEQPCWRDLVRKYRQIEKYDEGKKVLVRRPKGKEIYVIEKGEKRAVSSGAAFEKHGFKWEEVEDMKYLDALDAMPEGTALV